MSIISMCVCLQENNRCSPCSPECGYCVNYQMKSETMTVWHPRWSEFAEQLQGENGCNFREKFDGSDDYEWDCDGKSLTKSREILTQMNGIDVETSLTYFRNNGGHCDCEVVFNIILSND